MVDVAHETRNCEKALPQYLDCFVRSFLRWKWWVIGFRLNSLKKTLTEYYGELVEIFRELDHHNKVDHEGTWWCDIRSQLKYW